MNIDIDDNVPLPQPDAPSTWVTGVALNIPNKPVQYKSDHPKCKPVLIPEGCVECMLIGGPLNGQRGPIRGNAKTVELEVYDAQGNVTSVELYALGDNPTLTFRHHVGTKPP